MPYQKHFAKDKILKQLMREQGHHSISIKKNIPLQICASIISQQLSTKVAAVIFSRFINLFNTPSPKPTAILAIPHEDLRAIGLSNSKAVYIKNVCQFFIEHKLTDAKIHQLTNEELIAMLTQIKGVGKWTVEMILMFSLARKDVFSVGDLGLQKAMIQLYKIEHQNKKELAEKMEAIAKNWSPYRTYACRYLWQYLDVPLVPL